MHMHHEVYQRSPALYQEVQQLPGFPDGVSFSAVDTWHAGLVAPVDRTYVEDNLMSFWPVLRLKVGDHVVALANQAAGRTPMTTGMCGVVIGFQTFTVAAERQSQSFRVRDAAKAYHIVEVFRRLCGTTDAEGAPALVFPKVQFQRIDTSSHVTVNVKPQFRDVKGEDGVCLLQRWQLPLCGGRCIRFGQALGCTFGDDVFCDFSNASKCGTQRFMGVTRKGDPRHLFFDLDTPIAPDMFKVPDDILEWYDSAEWIALHVPLDVRRQRVQTLQHVATVPIGQDAEVHERFPLPLAF